MPQKILIVEDERKLAEIHRDYLTQAGFETQWIDNGLDVLPSIQAELPALIILDLMLPGQDGLEVCKEIRKVSNVPIIMVTARADEVDRLLGLELGADDYICKPFSPREVVARVKTVLRRSDSALPEREQLLSLCVEKQQALLCGEKLALTALEFQLLHFMASSPGRIFSRNQLMDHIYADQRIVCDRTIDTHIKKLRKKIAQVAPQLELIHSIYSVGYRYEQP